MANPQHLEIFKRQSMGDWQAFRYEHPDVVPDLSGEDISQFATPDKDLNGANLRDVKLSGRKSLLGRNLSGTQLQNADFTGLMIGQCNLTGADLSGAKLTEVQFALSDLSNASLQGAILTWTTFRGGRLEDTSFSGAGLLGTVFADVDLSEAKGLTEVRHHGPSTIGIDCIYRSQGRIPQAFLRAAGVQEPVILNAKALVEAVSPIQFYSCFISHSTKDQEFADRLYADLLARGVGCFYAPEHLKIGDPFRQRIDESIRLHDKLLLLLSEYSVQSSWVQDEVETALERERRENRVVLFPIRIDDAVMETQQAWAASIRRTRHIGDFRNWKDPSSYQTAFQRLLRDLRASSPTVAQ